MQVVGIMLAYIIEIRKLFSQGVRAGHSCSPHDLAGASGIRVVFGIRKPLALVRSRARQVHETRVSDHDHQFGIVAGY